jgi:KTSC domain
MRCPPIALFAIALLFASSVAADPAKAPEATGIISHLKRDVVQSTALASVGYSRRLRALEIEFRNGAIYRYLNVDPATYHSLMIAPSKARFYDEHIRRKFRSVHVKRRLE